MELGLVVEPDLKLCQWQLRQSFHMLQPNKNLVFLGGAAF